MPQMETPSCVLMIRLHYGYLLLRQQVTNVRGLTISLLKLLQCAQRRPAKVVSISHQTTVRHGRLRNWLHNHALRHFILTNAVCGFHSRIWISYIPWMKEEHGRQYTHLTFLLPILQTSVCLVPRKVCSAFQKTRSCILPMAARHSKASLPH